MDRVAVKLEQDLAPMDKGNGEKQVKSRSMNQYGHVMILKGSRCPRGEVNWANSKFLCNN